MGRTLGCWVLGIGLNVGLLRGLGCVVECWVGWSGGWARLGGECDKFSIL